VLSDLMFFLQRQWFRWIITEDTFTSCFTGPFQKLWWCLLASSSAPFRTTCGRLPWKHPEMRSWNYSRLNKRF